MYSSFGGEEAAIERGAGKYGMLLLAVLSTSVSALLVVYARDQGAGGFATAMWRNVIAAGVVLPLALLRGIDDILALSRRERLMLAASGVALGLHFASYIVSLHFTTVASTMFFVAITPVFVALGSHCILGERVSPPFWAAIAVTFCGGLLIVGKDLSELARIRGDALALAAALFVTVYLLVGRTLRPKLHIVSYVAATYTLAALTTTAATLVAGEPVVGYTTTAWLMFALLALGPSILGHGSYNWALLHFPSYVISVTNLGEPVIATVLAYLFLDQTPTPLKLAGGAVLLAGVVLAIHITRRGENLPQPID
ncbi:MAG: DMT family transporter [Verrucomicrobia bacterium]|nr:DMT family transporter [Verrucomicrobiota bacterium]